MYYGSKLIFQTHKQQSEVTNCVVQAHGIILLQCHTVYNMWPPVKFLAGLGEIHLYVG